MVLFILINHFLLRFKMSLNCLGFLYVYGTETLAFLKSAWANTGVSVISVTYLLTPRPPPMKFSGHYNSFCFLSRVKSNETVSDDFQILTFDWKRGGG